MLETAILERITADTAPVLDNLYELYVYDFSEQMALPIKPSGRFEMSPGAEWWSREGHFGYLIRWRTELAGFALVRSGSRLNGAPDVMDVAEFFVLRGVRGRGIGKSAAHAVFGAFPGAWEVRVRRTNGPARAFWSRAVESWVRQPVASTPFSVEGVDWDLLRFTVGSAQ